MSLLLSRCPPSQLHYADKPRALPPACGGAETLRALVAVLKAHPVVEVGSEEHDVKDPTLRGLLAVLKQVWNWQK